MQWFDVLDGFSDKVLFFFQWRKVTGEATAEKQRKKEKFYLHFNPNKTQCDRQVLFAVVLIFGENKS